jgi:DNA replication protein DnaC
MNEQLEKEHASEGTLRCHQHGREYPVGSECGICKRERLNREEAVRLRLSGRAEEKVEAVASLDSFPEVIRETDAKLLPFQLVEAVEAWNPSERRSVIIFGATRTGKSRASFLLARKFAEATGKSPVFHSMRTFEAAIMKSFRDKRHDEVLDGLCRAPLLILDDFGKEKLTDRIASDLFALIDDRTSNRRPTVITTNLNGDALEARLSHSDAELAAALVARLREFFVTVFAPSR